MVGVGVGVWVGVGVGVKVGVGVGVKVGVGVGVLVGVPVSVGVGVIVGVSVGVAVGATNVTVIDPSAPTTGLNPIPSGSCAIWFVLTSWYTSGSALLSTLNVHVYSGPSGIGLLFSGAPRTVTRMVVVEPTVPTRPAEMVLPRLGFAAQSVAGSMLNTVLSNEMSLPAAATCKPELVRLLVTPTALPGNPNPTPRSIWTMRGVLVTVGVAVGVGVIVGVSV